MIKFKYFLVENRVDFLRTQFNKQRMKSKEWNEKDGPNIDLLWDLIINVDPTRKKVYLQWVLKQVMRTDREFLKSEDMYKVTDALELYDKLKHKLDRSQRDINKFKTYRDLLDVADTLKDQKTGKEEKKDEHSEALKQSKIIYQGSQGSIIIPKTEFASCILGKGTRWCTAATGGHNYFKDYNDMGPLYVITIKNGDKYQLHFETISLMDAKDSFVHLRKFIKDNSWVFKKIKLSEAHQKRLINSARDGNYPIMLFPFASEKVYMASLAKDPYSITSMYNPSEKIQIQAAETADLIFSSIKEYLTSTKARLIWHDRLEKKGW